MEKNEAYQELKETKFEERLKNAETFINDTNNNSNSDSDSSKEVLTESTPFLNNSSSTNSLSDNTSPQDHKNIQYWTGMILIGAIASLFTLNDVFLSNTVKIYIMFITSFTLTTIGFIVNKMKPEDTFYEALLVCGSVYIYLSILMTGIHFKEISSTVMYILIVLWAVLILFLKNNKSDWLFFAVGNLGYFVSVLYTVNLEGIFDIISILTCIVMISAIYQIMYWENESQRYYQNIINVFSLLLFLIITICQFDNRSEVIIVGIVFIAFVFTGFIIKLTLTKRKNFIWRFLI